MKTAIVYMIVGAFAWFAIVQDIRIHSLRQWIAAAVLLFMFIAPGIQIMLDCSSSSSSTSRSNRQRSRGQSSPPAP